MLLYLIMRTLTEILVESLQGTHIFEMANNRENYMNDVHHLADQIVQNWCLVKYCNLYDEENYNRLHWSKELIAHLDNLRKQKLKKGINKIRATQQVLIDRDEFNDPDMVYTTIESKFDMENIETDLNILSKEFVKDLNKIIDLICNKTYSDIKKYVYEEI